MTLYEIDERLMNCFTMPSGEVVDTSTGEIFSPEYLDDLEMARNEKIENIALFIKDLKAEAEALKKEKQALEKRQKEAERKAETLKEYLMERLDGQKFKSAKVSISYRTTQDVVKIDDLSVIPFGYFKSKLEWTDREREQMLKKTDIKDALTAGLTVKGAHLEDTTSMVIR